MKTKKYQQSVELLESLKNLPIPDYMKNRQDNPGFYIKRMRALLNRLGNPEKNFKFIHVTGTSGKGSTCSMIQNILTAAGIKTGVFFSPHITTTIERFRVNEKYMSAEDFSKIVDFLTPAIKDNYLHSKWGRPSYFETVLAIALLYFQKKKCRYVVLEAGCGGRYDATNAIPHSEISMVTNVDLDHMHILGDTKEKIAYDKAGIIKKGSIFLTTEQNPKLLNIFKKECHKNKAKFIHIESPAQKTHFLTKYQKINAALAIKTAEFLDIDHQYIKEGIKMQKMPCRFEVMQKNPLVILDGAHNPAKMKSVVAAVKNLKYKKLFLITTVAGNKDYKKVIREIAPLADEISITRYNAPRECADLKILKNTARKYAKKNIKVDIDLNPWHSLKQTLAKAEKNDLVLITGSFYLCGELRRHWISEEYVLKNRQSF